MAKTATVTQLKPKKWAPPKPFQRKINLKTQAGKRNTTKVMVEHEHDPKKVLLDRVGPLDASVVQFSRILVAVYQPPVVTKTAGGILLTQGMSEEDVEEYLWQGKVGLIVAMGPQAYVDDDNVKFHGTENKVGDWVWFRPSDGIGCEVNEVFCRVLREADIIGKVSHPDAIW